MSSEQRFNFSYEQFVEDSLPSFDLFDESAGTSSYELQEDHLANPQQIGQSFFSDTHIFEQNSIIPTTRRHYWTLSL
jgi:hypothetical protein